MVAWPFRHANPNALSSAVCGGRGASQQGRAPALLRHVSVIVESTDLHEVSSAGARGSHQVRRRAPVDQQTRNVHDSEK